MTGRFSPSPTGKLHIGSLRTALISFIIAKKNQGDFVLRIEDTDKVRSTRESEQEIFDSFEWLGIKYRDGVIRQSEQEAAGVYSAIVEDLIKSGFAYRCNCSVDTLKAMKIQQIKNKEARIGYTGLCREAGNTTGVVRIHGKRLAEARQLQHYRFHDFVFGNRKVDHRDIPDAIIQRADGTATYVLANTLDDMQAGVDFIARGADIITQTAIQIALREGIHYTSGIPKPEVTYTHLPLILGAQKEKLSKRNEDTKSILDYKNQGFFKDAIMQFVLSLGNKSISIDRAMSLEEIIEVYDVSQLRRNDTAFTESTLRYVNGLHMCKATPKEVSDILLDICGTTYDLKWIEAFKSRCKTVVELNDKLHAFLAGVQKAEKDIKVLQDSKFSIPACQKFRQEFLHGMETPPLEEILSA